MPYIIFQLEPPSYHLDHFPVVTLQKITLYWMKYTLVILEPNYIIVSVRMACRNAIILIVITIAMVTLI